MHYPSNLREVRTSYNSIIAFTKKKKTKQTLLRLHFIMHSTSNSDIKTNINSFFNILNKSQMTT